MESTSISIKKGYWLSQYRGIIIVITVVATIASFVFSYFKPVTYDTSISFQINRINKQETVDYQYDGYYAIQASDLFSQTVMSWFKTPSVLLEIYDQAGIDPRINSMERFTSRFKTKQYSPQNVVIRFKENDKVTAEKISQAIVDIIPEKASQSNQTSEQEAFFEVIGAKPVIVENKPLVWLVTILGFVGGLVGSIILIYIIRYFREEKQN